MMAVATAAPNPADRRKRRRRRLAFYGLGGLAALIAAAGAAWWVARGETEALLERAREDGPRQGYALDHRGLDFSGFPLELQASLSRPRLTWDNGSWQGPATVTGGAWLTDPYAIELKGAGRHQLVLGPVTVDIDAAVAEAQVELASGGPEALSINLEGLDLWLAGSGEAAGRLANLDIGAAPLPPLMASSDVTALSVEMDGLVLPVSTPFLTDRLGTEIQSLRLDADLTGPLAPGPPDLVARLWRESGGHLRVRHLAFAWGGLQVEAKGMLSLDRALRPMGELALEVSGLPQLLESFAAAGLLDPSMQRYAGLLAGMAREREGRSGTWLPVPLQLVDGIAYLKLPLTRIPLFRVQPVITSIKRR